VLFRWPRTFGIAPPGQPIENQEYPPQESRVIAGHTFLNGDVDFGLIVFPSPQNFDLLVRGETALREDIFWRFENGAWVQQSPLDIDSWC
jgi:hypothetical protein